MKVTVTFTLSDYERQAINAHYGRKGKASRKDCQDCIYSLALSDLESIESDYTNENKTTQESVDVFDYPDQEAIPQFKNTKEAK